MDSKLDETINRTPNPKCPACINKRFHEAPGLDAYHPLAGHGFIKEQGWTHPSLGKTLHWGVG